MLSSDDKANNTPKIMVLMKIVLSKPRLVRQVLIESDPPKASPKPVELCCRRIAVTSNTEITT